MRDFVNRALRAQKIAREKNNCHNLAVVAKKVGSNYSLFNRRLSADLNFPFAALASGGGVASAAPNKFAISQLVLVFGKIRTYFKGAAVAANQPPQYL